MRRLIVGIPILLLLSCVKKTEPADAVLQLRELNELVTVEYDITKVIKASDDKSWFKIGERKILMSCKATARAGIDLSQISEKDIRIEGTECTLKIPEAKIISINIRPEDIRTEYQEIGVFRSDFTAQERNDLMTQGEAQIRSQLTATGLLQTAESNAALVLEKFIRQLGFEKVNIVINRASPTALPKLN